MKEYNVKTDEDFFNRIISIKNDVQVIASMFQNEGVITSEEQIQEWSIYINKVVDKIESTKQQGYERFELR